MRIGQSLLHLKSRDLELLSSNERMVIVTLNEPDVNVIPKMHTIYENYQPTASLLQRPSYKRKHHSTQKGTYYTAYNYTLLTPSVSQILAKASKCPWPTPHQCSSHIASQLFSFTGFLSPARRRKLTVNFDSNNTNKFYFLCNKFNFKILF